MKCPKCNTKKSMGITQARLSDGSLAPTYLCSPCGCNVLIENYSVGFIELYDKVVDIAKELDELPQDRYIVNFETIREPINVPLGTKLKATYSEE